MELTGEERIEAPLAIVWACLNDPAVLKDCIPGCETLDWVSDHQLAAGIKVRFGPIGASFSGSLTLSNVVPQESYTLTGEGKGGLAGFARGSADVFLTDMGEETLLRYAGRAEISGKLASLGARYLGSSSQKLASRFFAGLNETIVEAYRNGHAREA